MMATVPRIYVAHAIFWLTFAAGGLLARARRQAASGAAANAARPAGEAPLSAPGAGLLVGVHMVAFALMYGGVGRAVFGARVTEASPSLRIAGAIVIIAGGVLAGLARLAFTSWRFRAQLDAGHQLATGGPFRWLRHPIYAALDLLALGTALWIPTRWTWLAVLAMVIGGELRARAEEPLLERAFGDSYREYRGRTKRFIPGVY
jgi:protein-S-isoprenylcysteine O-methyltransferase Ste14